MFRSLDLPAISKCVQALAYLTRHTLQYIVCWKRLFLFTNGLCPKAQPFKTWTLGDSILTGSFLLPVKKDNDGEIKLFEKWRLNSWTY